jgi:hypothetical protein
MKQFDLTTCVGREEEEEEEGEEEDRHNPLFK